jgi:hypothetical protein
MTKNGIFAISISLIVIAPLFPIMMFHFFPGTHPLFSKAHAKFLGHVLRACAF